MAHRGAVEARLLAVRRVTRVILHSVLFAIGPLLGNAIAQAAQTPTLLVTPPDVSRARAEDAREPRDTPPRFALPVAVHNDLRQPREWERTSSGSLLRRLRVVSPGATSLSLGFGRFHLPPGAELRVVSASTTSAGEVSRSEASNGEPSSTGTSTSTTSAAERSAIRPFASRDNAVHGQLWTPIVPGDALELSLEVPESALGDTEVVLTSVNVGYRSFSSAIGEKSGACNVDVVCPVAAPSADLVRSVAVYSLGGSRICTGAMVNNTALDFRPLFLTAAHCGVTSGNAPSVVTYWNYQNHWCRAVGSAASASPGDGSLGQFETGAVFLASSSASDFTLLELDSAPNPALGIRWAGWNRSDTAPPCTAARPCVVLHHPNGQEKRVTLSETATAITSYLAETSPGDGSHLHAFWSLGVTEPGSSGSPLFDADGRIVGQLHGGPSACGATGNALSDYFGRLSVSWDGSSSATRLSDWLDPGGSGTIKLDGADPSHRFHTLTPCRLLDTRDPDGPLGGPALSAGVPRVVRAHTACGIPTTAHTLAVNLTAAQATSGGHLSLYPAAQVPAPTSVLGIPAVTTRASNALATLGADGAFTLLATLPAGQAHAIVDVTGYFE